MSHKAMRSDKNVYILKHSVIRISINSHCAEKECYQRCDNQRSCQVCMIASYQGEGCHLYLIEGRMSQDTPKFINKMSPYIMCTHYLLSHFFDLETILLIKM